MALWAHNRMMFDRDYTAALSLIGDAMDLSPNDAEALAWSVPTLTTTRHAEDAVRNGRRALELSPYDPFIFRNEHFLSFALFSQGDYDASAEYGLSSFRRSPNYSGNIRATIAALVAAGRSSEAVPLVDHHLKLYPDFSVMEFERIQGFRNPADRKAFATLLLDAGLPA
jgi:tetratricopeptide (TPR) repeat protein